MKYLKKLKALLLRIIKSYTADSDTTRFIAHNKGIWGCKKQQPEIPSSEVLVEFTELHSLHIASSYLTNVLAVKYKAKIIGYFATGTAKSIIFRFLAASRVCLSYNTNHFVNISLTRGQVSRAALLHEYIYSTLGNKRDVENIVVEDVWIGDLIYDSYLMSEKVPTIDIKSPSFISALRESISIFVFWRDYFESHNVKAILVSHCVYNLAIPLRVAVTRNIKVYQANATHIYMLEKKNLFAYSDFYSFPSQFKKISKEQRDVGISEARQRIERRFSGEAGVDMPYSTKSAYGAQRKARVLRESAQTKVLIATHCFFDSPHGYGNNLFPDYYEWLNFLGRISEITDYDWYIKTHPDSLPGNKEVIEYFLEKYPKFTLIPADTSHHQIISEGIDFALTVHGTIGLEYAALGIPVVNASLCNPHIAYTFNIHPKSVQEYESTLLKLNEIELIIDRSQVYEYYFMKFIYNDENWLFQNYSRMISHIGGYMEQFTSRVYRSFIDEYTPLRHERLLKTLHTFVESGDFRMNQSHTRDKH